MIQQEILEQLIVRFEALEAQLSDSANLSGEELGKLSKEYSGMTPVVEAARALSDMMTELDDLRKMGEDPQSDEEMRALAEQERRALEDQLPALEHEVQLLLLPKDMAGEKNVILEVRAGTGGDEAALFAGDLFRMYQRYADTRGWKVEIMSASESSVGGYKEVVAAIAGKGAFAKLKYESGVHRVQRVPETESGGRVHTSAATVAVLPEAEEVDIDIEEKDLRIDVFRASGAGGQHVNKTDSAVRITHIPSGVVVSQQDSKSQHKNRAKAMTILRARLYDAERQRQDNARSDARRGQVGSGDRSERIRTYNFPQNRVTDHRINLTLYKLDHLIQGEGLDELVDALAAAEQAEMLASDEVAYQA